MAIMNSLFPIFLVIGQVSYYASLLGSNKDRMRSTQTVIKLGLY